MKKIKCTKCKKKVEDRTIVEFLFRKGKYCTDCSAIVLDELIEGERYKGGKDDKPSDDRIVKE